MAKHSFEVTFQGAAQATLAKAREGLEAHGGSLTGDETSGTLLAATPLGKVTGTYRVAGQTIALVITDKPFMVPVSAIESQVRKFLGG